LVKDGGFMIAEIRDITQIVFNLCGIAASTFIVFTLFFQLKEDKKRKLKKLIEEIIEEKKNSNPIDDDDNVFSD
jgi:hypothetical protein